ncbi:ABC transporter permease [Clostridiaceae bacterium UIB06]|uniref:ABC transporter permease n=1 Tax=Clostridium thailandense TaxID=2794346 RepID=A0A949TNE0_9CLOT|nr:ABC transporter permease [Clostridium thailandense]MBV7273632.1 ABC transporter permease [Clostridium thailandense]MCH5137024.1 ABC transporter permease [Clostridiaceae bacterium UIB06]
MKSYKKSINRFISIIFQFVLIFSWQLAVDKGGIPKYILPSPSDIVSTLFRIMPDLKPHIYATLYEAVIGFLFSIILAIVLAVLMDSIKLIKSCIYPILVISQTIPTIALAPIFIIWFGFGVLPKVIVVIMVCFFPIVISLVDGLEEADNDMLSLMDIMGASRIQKFIFVKFPGCLGSFFSGLRIAATYSIMGAVIGEWLGGDKGLGIFMVRAKNAYALDKIFAAIIVIIILSMALFVFMYMLQYIFMPWQRKIRER